MDVGAPFPARGVGVAGADVFRLQALEFLLGAEFVGLGKTSCQSMRSMTSEVQGQLTIVLVGDLVRRICRDGKTRTFLAVSRFNQCLWRPGQGRLLM